MSKKSIQYASNDSFLWETQRAFTFQTFPTNYSMQMCNPVTSANALSDTSINNNQIVNTNNNNSSVGTSVANGSLVVDNLIKPTNFALNEDSNGIKDATKKSARDPLSHRIIEKRRRDRMNKCLNDLSKLIPQNYIKKARGRVEKTEIVEMAIKYINHLRENNKNIFNSTPETGTKFKNLTFGTHILDNSHLKMNSLSTFNLNQFKDESEQSNASLQNSLQNSMNLTKQTSFNETVNNEDYLNGFKNGYRDCYSEVIKFLTNTSILQQSTKDRFNEQLIIDQLKVYLDAQLINQQQQEINSSLTSKRRVDFSPKSSTIDGLQIKLEEMDVEESSNKFKKHQEKLNFEDKFNKLASFKAGNLQNNANSSVNLNLTKDDKHLMSKCPSNNTLKNYLANNDLSKTDYFKNNCFGNLDLNSSIKSRSLTSSPNSSNLDGGYKFKSSIREKFDAEFSSKMCKSELNSNDHTMTSRPRSATVGANATASIRRLNAVTLELKEKIGNSNAELNNAFDTTKLLDNKCLNSKILMNSNSTRLGLNHPPLPLKSNLMKKTTPGFVLHPNQLFYIPIEIDLNNLMTHFTKPNPDDLLINLQQVIQQQNLLGKQQTLNSRTMSSQNSLNQFQDHLSYSSPSLNSLNSINNSSIPAYLNGNNSMKCCLDDIKEQDHILYPISISVNFKFPPLSLNAILNSQKSSS